MSDAYVGDIFNSDLDAFKQSGIKTASVTYSGTLAAGEERVLSTEPITLDSLDFTQILFDNSYYHPGRYRNLSLENATMIQENTGPSELTCNTSQLIVGNTVVLQARIQNPYSIDVALATTTINFLYIPYQATI